MIVLERRFENRYLDLVGIFLLASIKMGFLIVSFDGVVDGRVKGRVMII